jgi:CRISPR-associated protein Csb1
MCSRINQYSGERNELMSEEKALTLQDVEKAILNHGAAAFRCITKLQPVGGPGDKLFPPTYEGGKYSVEERIAPSGEIIKCVLLDSVQSQANRMEMALLDAVREKRISLPLLEVKFDQQSLKKKIVVTSLDAPHRVADAIFRDSLIDGITFRKSEKGKILDCADLRNSTGLFGLCPTALLFGIWDSTGPRGGLGTKFQRAIVSEIIGYNAVSGVKTSSRIDPLQIMLGAGPLYVRNEKTDKVPDWTFEKDKAMQEKNQAKKLGKDGKPSESNHGNITPTITDGGFTISYALQTTVISLSALRRLCFPLSGCVESALNINNAARITLAVLGLTAATLAQENGLDLRSRCQLFPMEKSSWELLDDPTKLPARYNLDSKRAENLLKEAIEKAKEMKLPWEGTIELTPTDDLLTLVAKSQELAASEGAGEV